MEALYTNIDIDFSQYSFQTIQAVAGETGDSRGVIVSLYNEGQPYYIPDVNAVECYIMGTKSDNKYADTKCTIIDDNTVSFTLTDQMVAVPGTGEYSLVLMDFNDGTVLKSFGFKVHVEENAENINIVISSNEFNILMDALNEAKEATDAAKENLEQTQQALEEVLTSKEAIETLAENLSILNETIVQGEAERANAEAERIAAETERINAESARQNAFDEAIAEANEIIDACKDIVTDSANIAITFEDYENIEPPAFNDSVSSIASGEKLPNLMQHIKGALLSVEDVLENVDISSQKTLLVDVPTLGWEGNNPYTITLSAPGVKIDSSIVYYLVTKEDDASPEEMLTMRNILSVDPGVDVIVLTASALPKTEITLALGGLSNNVEFIPSDPSGGNSEDLAALEERVDAVEDQSATALSIAKGKNQAHIFNTTDDMNAWMSVSDNAGLYAVGDNIYIIDTDVPDWWVSEVLTEADPDTGFYYKIAQLETQKVDLTNYVSKEQLGELNNELLTHSHNSIVSDEYSAHIQGDGNLVIYDNEGVAEWNSKESDGKIDNLYAQISEQRDKTVPKKHLIYSDASKKEDMLNQLNNPTLLFGKQDTSYEIIFDDQIGDSSYGGGQTLIMGHTYASDAYGKQLSISYARDGIKERRKMDGVWTEWTDYYGDKITELNGKLLGWEKKQRPIEQYGYISFNLPEEAPGACYLLSVAYKANVSGQVNAIQKKGLYMVSFANRYDMEIFEIHSYSYMNYTGESYEVVFDTNSATGASANLWVKNRHQETANISALLLRLV